MEVPSLAVLFSWLVGMASDAVKDWGRAWLLRRVGFEPASGRPATNPATSTNLLPAPTPPALSVPGWPFFWLAGLRAWLGKIHFIKIVLAIIVASVVLVKTGQLPITGDEKSKTTIGQSQEVNPLIRAYKGCR